MSRPDVKGMAARYAPDRYDGDGKAVKIRELVAWIEHLEEPVTPELFPAPWSVKLGWTDTESANIWWHATITDAEGAEVLRIKAGTRHHTDRPQVPPLAELLVSLRNAR